jgi:5-formyltetrahydrofolate cyclo-ligase
MAGNVSSDKAALRKAEELRRRALSPEVVQRWGGEVQKHLAALPLFSDRIIRAVAVYDAQPFEVPLADFVTELSSRGVPCVYPRVVKGTRVLVFHHVGDQWAKGPFGIREPASHSPVRAIDEIDVFIVPGVAFARDGRRLGRGAGYYDSTLSLRNSRAQTIGVAFECNVVSAVPTEPHDVRVDFLATERGVFAAQESDQESDQ